MKKDAVASLAGCSIISVGCVGLVVLSSIVSTLIIYFGWNLALGPILDKGPITFLQAFLIGLVLGVLSNFFRGSVRVDR